MRHCPSSGLYTVSKDLHGNSALQGTIRMLLHEDEVSGFILYIFNNEPSVGSELQRPACNVRSRVANVLLIIPMC